MTNPIAHLTHDQIWEILKSEHIAARDLANERAREHRKFRGKPHPTLDTLGRLMRAQAADMALEALIERLETTEPVK